LSGWISEPTDGAHRAAIEKERYFSIQLIDAYTFNFDYIGSRTTGNEGGSYMIADRIGKARRPRG